MPFPHGNRDVVVTLGSHDAEMTRGTWIAAAALVVLAGCGDRTASEGAEGAEGVDALPAAVEGWKWQSFATLHFQVPDSWRRGSPDQWCTEGRDLTPSVLSPEASQTAALCTHPFQTYGARMIRVEDVTPDMADPDRTAAQAMGKYGDGIPGRAYPEGAVVEVVTSDEWAVAIVAPDQVTLDGIADSVTLSDVDSVGCSAEADRPTSQDGEPVIDGLDPKGVVTLCHYAGSGYLRLGEQFDAADSAAAIEAFRATVPGADPGDCDEPLPDWAQPWVEVRTGTDIFWAALATPNGCLGVGLTDGDETRSLSTDSLYWLMTTALDWSYDQSTPIPDQRRDS